jgi:hypothetical protein
LDTGLLSYGLLLSDASRLNSRFNVRAATAGGTARTSRTIVFDQPGAPATSALAGTMSPGPRRCRGSSASGAVVGRGRRRLEGQWLPVGVEHAMETRPHALHGEHDRGK